MEFGSIWFKSAFDIKVNHNLDILSKRIVHVPQESKKKIMILIDSKKSSHPLESAIFDWSCLKYLKAFLSFVC